MIWKAYVRKQDEYRIHQEEKIFIVRQRIILNTGHIGRGWGIVYFIEDKNAHWGSINIFHCGVLCMIKGRRGNVVVNKSYSGDLEQYNREVTHHTLL